MNPKCKPVEHKWMVWGTDVYNDEVNVYCTCDRCKWEHHAMYKKQELTKILKGEINVVKPILRDAKIQRLNIRERMSDEYTEKAKKSSYFSQY